ncbi:hypothetical protein [Actinoplanes sp. NPDC051851]|uniref:hypothetical protein n=1 Tax=Actinoplanes sp. NPDC051851 TaxID=3154753 RepID=UPI00341B93B3
MTRRFTSGFGILGMSADPTPGDPEQIERLARDYEEIRDDAQTALTVLGRGGSLSQARGDAMTALRGMLDKLPGKLQRTVDSFDTAANAYRTYAQALRDQQTRVDTAMDQAGEVASIARTAPPRPAPDATPEEFADARKAASDILDAKAGLSAARQLAEDARRLREAASARCNRELDDAAAQAIKPPPKRNFFQRIGDFFRNNPIARLIVDIIIAVVGVVLPVVGLVLAAVSIVVTAAVQAANHTFELGTLLVGLVSLVPAGVLFGPVVKFADGVAPTLVRSLKSTAKAFGELGEGNTVLKGLINTTAEFGRNSAEELATAGLNRAADPNAGFNAAAIFAGAAAGTAVSGGVDAFRKVAPSRSDLGFSSAGKQTGGTSADAATPDTGGSTPTASPDASPSAAKAPDAPPPATTDPSPAGSTDGTAPSGTAAADSAASPPSADPPGTPGSATPSSPPPPADSSSPAVSGTPSAPETSPAPQVPDAPTAPEAPAAPVVPQAPDIPPASSAPDASTAPPAPADTAATSTPTAAPESGTTNAAPENSAATVAPEDGAATAVPEKDLSEVEADAEAEPQPSFADGVSERAKDAVGGALAGAAQGAAKGAVAGKEDDELGRATLTGAAQGAFKAAVKGEEKKDPPATGIPRKSRG